jgi:hypothetical protein
VNALPIADAWIYSGLSGDAQLIAAVGERIYRRFAPEGAAFPFVVFGAQTGGVQLTTDGRKVWDTPVYQIKVVSVAPADDGAVSAANRIHALFADREGVAFSLDGRDYVFASLIEQNVNFNEFDKIYYEHLGGFFRLAFYEEESL